MKIFSLLMLLLCVHTHTLADDELDTGPGVFSGKSGAFSLFKSSKEKQDNVQGGVENSTPRDEQSTTQNTAQSTVKNTIQSHEQHRDITPTKKDEFSLFKQWKAEKKHHTIDYQEFLLWVEYQQYVKNKD